MPLSPDPAAVAAALAPAQAQAQAPAQAPAAAAICHPPSEARLTLGLARDGITTRLAEHTFFGPLRIQKLLYPEGPQLCHAVIVHPPGGIVGGDRLKIEIHVEPHAQALVTTPGAAKWYRANSCESRQSVQLTIAANASLEWLPQETIFFNAARVRMRHEVDMAAGSVYVASEILCFGRSAAGETFDSGSIAQRTTIVQDGALLWSEQGSIAGGDASMSGITGLGGRTICATLMAVGDGLDMATVDAIRADVSLAMDAVTSAGSGFGVSLVKSVLVARFLGNSSALARTLMYLAWARVRPVLVGRAAAMPRLWRT